MKILVIDDEPKTREYMRSGLTESAYVVDVAVNGREGLFMAEEYHYDLILLDVMMPELNGWEVIKTLELGADDYLVKPFSFAELLARIRTALRRGMNGKREELLTVADLRLDIAKRRVERAGRRIDLTNKEFNLLQFFMSNPGQVMSRTLIASRVWDMNSDSDTNVVDVAVRRLRQKEDKPFPHPLIHTVHDPDGDGAVSIASETNQRS
ncbi:MAG: winged helix-turn-helix domain-containing protein [Sodalis sp. (in: enterobacteria)]|uniref:winged helix-turn-helix domain-containing protein n=1 Tax=Sodalis sp. (in: enterobacteria) TaxID=1898979 RepID=UPI003F336ADC